jgi:uncharacterized protein (DUF1501 family)
LPTDRPAIAAAFAALYGRNDALGAAYRDGQEAHRQLAADMPAEDPERVAQGAPGAVRFPDTAARLAQLMAADDRIFLAFADLGGWDTHVNQGAATGQLARHLAALGDGLAALAHGLGSKLDNIMVLVMSEFGRTARENGNGGTDHGHGTVMWLLGGQTDGGKIHGSWPGLDDDRLYQGRDLAVTTDFRSVLAIVLRAHCGLTAGQVATVLPALPEPAPTLSRLVRS